jgi:adenosylmethionine-8-amino-7-oxononanoate aminotransferase
MVQPCYAYRNQPEGESDADYVERLAQDLESKFQELGPGTVAAFFAEPGE